MYPPVGVSLHHAPTAKDAAMSSRIARRRVSILGIRGIPARHGGFETFAEGLALYLSRAGWEVTVYCQIEPGERVGVTVWEGIRLVHLAGNLPGALGTILFDLRSTWHACGHAGLVLTLGYNTAFLLFLLRLRGVANLINMDGLEWKRSKYGLAARTWLYLNERIACWLGDHLVADHPAIADHLATRVRRNKITTIAYGAEAVPVADPRLLADLGLAPGAYALVIARPEPENSIREIVAAYSARRRGMPLVVLGRYETSQAYHRAVKAAASDEVRFPGAIYDKAVVQALRRHCCIYIHGHQVGGTNPSLIEALGAGNPVLAHDNCFNRWVAGPEAAFFSQVEDCAAAFDRLLADDALRAAMGHASQARQAELFRLDDRHEDYRRLLAAWQPEGARGPISILEGAQ